MLLIVTIILFHSIFVASCGRNAYLTSASRHLPFHKICLISKKWRSRFCFVYSPPPSSPLVPFLLPIHHLPRMAWVQGTPVTNCWAWLNTYLNETGKCWVLAHTITPLLIRDKSEKIVVYAPTHIAVDNLLRRAADI